MTIRKDTYEVFYINFSLVEKLQNLPDGSQGIALSFQRPIITSTPKNQKLITPFFKQFNFLRSFRLMDAPLANLRCTFYLTLIKNTLRNGVKQTSKVNEIIKQ